MENASFFNYNSAFATRLRELISKNNISKNQLSEEIEVSRQAISQYCDGSTIPNADKLLKIAEYFNVSLDYLVGRTENTTIDNELRFVCDYTGLNEKAVKNLNEWVNEDFFNLPIEFVSYLILNGAVRLSELAFKYKANLTQAAATKENLLKLSDSISQEEFELLARDACHKDLLSDVNLLRFEECFNKLIEQLAKSEKERNLELEKELSKNQAYLREKLFEESL